LTTLLNAISWLRAIVDLYEWQHELDGHWSLDVCACVLVLAMIGAWAAHVGCA